MRVVTFALAAACCMSAASAVTIMWNATLPQPTASSNNPLGEPVAMSAFSSSRQIFYYIDSQYNLNAINATSGAAMWAAQPGYSGGIEVADEYDAVISTGFSGTVALDTATGAALWNTSNVSGVSYEVALPTLLFHGRYLTCQNGLNDNLMPLWQIDVSNGNMTWQVQNILNAPQQCLPDLTIAVVDSFTTPVTLGVNLTTGAVVWESSAFWGTGVLGCTTPRAGERWGAIHVAVEGTPIVAVFDAANGTLLRNVSVREHFHERFLVYLRGSVMCSLIPSGFGPASYAQWLTCYDLANGMTLFDHNTTSLVIQNAYDIDGELVIMLRDYATSGAVQVIALDPRTGKSVWEVSTYTPYEDDVYYQPNTAVIGKYVVVNHVDGVTAISRHRSFNVTGLGTEVRVSSLYSPDELAATLYVACKQHAYRIDVTA
jgi:outer membrane protein assembly factor BamB